mmetsp:Transcript_27903/g.59717  ORF Transcript_27903/g.59717 Transcript_27903/m.59717 type:complete len:202 (-) Transcript_27903:122-727(-)
MILTAGAPTPPPPIPTIPPPPVPGRLGELAPLPLPFFPLPFLGFFFFGSFVGSGFPSIRALMTSWYNCPEGVSYLSRMEVFPLRKSMSMPPFSVRNFEQAAFPPPAFIEAICFGVQESILTLRTKLTWVPRLLWIPLHSRQTKIPRVTDAHSGFKRPQSMHRSLPGNARRTARSSGIIIVAAIVLFAALLVRCWFVALLVC